MDLKTKSETAKAMIAGIELPGSSSIIVDPVMSVSTDATGTPEYVHAFEHEVDGYAVQSFQVYVSEDSVTLQYEYSTSCFLPFAGNNHIERAVEDVGRFLKRGLDLAVEQEAERRQQCRS